jgi:hypothetical protein
MWLLTKTPEYVLAVLIIGGIFLMLTSCWLLLGYAIGAIIFNDNGEKKQRTKFVTVMRYTAWTILTLLGGITVAGVCVIGIIYVIILPLLRGESISKPAGSCC